MYQPYWQLDSRPFEHASDARFVFAADSQRGALLKLRYVLEKVWHLPYRDVTAADIAAGGLSGTDVLIVPNGSDDTNAQFAAIATPAAVSGTYRLRTSSFEAVDTGVLTVIRD